MSGSEQGKRGEVMSPGLAPVTAGTVTASLLHRAPSTALGLLRALSSARKCCCRQAGNGRLLGAGKNSLAGFYHFKGNKFQFIALVRACMVLALLA